MGKDKRIQRLCLDKGQTAQTNKEGVLLCELQECFHPDTCLPGPCKVSHKLQTCAHLACWWLSWGLCSTQGSAPCHHPGPATSGPLWLSPWLPHRTWDWIHSGIILVRGETWAYQQYSGCAADLDIWPQPYLEGRCLHYRCRFPQRLKPWTSAANPTIRFRTPRQPQLLLPDLHFSSHEVQRAATDTQQSERFVQHQSQTMHWAR